MSRAMVDGLATPVPLGSLLPDVYQRYDENILTFADALDEVIAPVWLVLDNYDAYIDPMLAPLDFLNLLASWVAFPIDRNWNEDQTRRLIATAVELYRWRGTRRGLVELVKAYAGVEPEVVDSGGAVWSAEPGATAPGSSEPAVSIAVELATVSIDLERMTRLIAANVPAHVAVTVEVQRGGRTTERIDASLLQREIEALPSAGVAGGSAEVSPYGPSVVEAADPDAFDAGMADPGATHTDAVAPTGPDEEETT